MARNHHNHLHLPEMEHIQSMNGAQNEILPLGQKLLMHPGSDAPFRIGPSGHGSLSIRSDDFSSSSHAVQYGHRVGAGISHVPFVPYSAGSSSSHLPYDAKPEPAVSYPHRSEEGSAPIIHLDNRSATMKRKHPIIHPVDGTSAGDHYVGSSSNTQLSNYMHPDPSSVTEPMHAQMPLSIGHSNWNGQRVASQEGSQRNVRARHNRNISLEPRSTSTYTSNNTHPLSFHSTASASLSTSVERNHSPISMPTRPIPSGAPGITSRALMDRLYYLDMQSSNSGVAAVPTIHGSYGSATFSNGAYAPRAVHSDTVPTHMHPASAASSSSRAVPHEAVIRSYPPASAADTSTSVRMNQPSPTIAVGSSRHARHVSVGHANSGRNRRARSSYYGFHPLMIEAERFMMMDQLVFHEPRIAADPHRDMRLDIDSMSYEDLLALGDFIGNVNTGLADEKISGCVKEVVCCSPDQAQNDQDDGSCVICLEEYKDKDLLGVLKCNHDFHADCIKKWLQKKNSCPVCKATAA
ncbi:E3 ubiquitin-protein ligase MBR2-like [Phragmites australis]|uniref:E3 ubiquitin-protein ligase MBR2-like n=1 Tax=Phragmites australis TaxID=29695 RepID=UPI002D792773|nr:E3 ubiquitin-protein ligase MBR2-like [Phragmites australis]XP_062193444.1 E3 ubiquitin-protein ligase MBR2-like [Phragmites australis]